MKKYLQGDFCTPLPDTHEADDLLFRAAMAKVSPSEAVDLLYGLINRPIIAFDTSFRLIAYAFPRPFFYEPWEELASTGVLSDKYIYENDSLSFQERMYYLKSSSVFNTAAVAACPQVDGPVIAEDQLIGYVGICIADDSEIEELLYINDRLAETLALLVPLDAGSSHDVRSQEAWEQFLRSDMSDAHETAQMEKLYRPAYRVAVLTAQPGQIPTLKYIKGWLDGSGRPLRTYININEQLVVFFYEIAADPSENNEERFLDFLSEYTDRYQMTGGLSDTFYHLGALPVARLQAEISADIGRRQSAYQRMFSFRRMYKDILCGYALERYGVHLSMPPFIREKGVSGPLLATLEAYLNNDCNKEKAALSLGIHKNTVSYRLNRFTELTGADPTDTSVMLQLKIGSLMHHCCRSLEKQADEEAEK